MNKKILIICGQTATGKTKLGVDVARKFNGEIISADSRQVYKEMDIGTGKDLSEYGDIKYWGIDLVNPNEDFSVSHFREYALQKIEEILSRNKLPIIVGGTGLYINALFTNFDNLSIKRDEKLREELSDKSVDDLFLILKDLDEDLANSLNNSDRNNKVRLIRKIEISKSSKKIKNNLENNFDTFWIGLKLDKQKLAGKIKLRVEKRIEQGFEEEFNNLLEKYGELDLFKNTLGYGQWPDKEKWIKQEIKYAKRQLTWFKANSKINWFESDEDNLIHQVEDLVNKWHN